MQFILRLGPTESVEAPNDAVEAPAADVEALAPADEAEHAGHASFAVLYHFAVSILTPVCSTDLHCLRHSFVSQCEFLASPVSYIFQHFP